MTTQSRLAIIGTGIAGMGCAHFLHRHFDLTLFEQNAHVGGHTNTIEVPEEDRSISMDTGFMVFNEVTYPNLTRLFKELGVEVKKSSMSFSVQHVPSGLEFCGSSVNHLFAQRRNLFRPRFWRMLNQIDRFNREADTTLRSGAFADFSVRRYVDEKGYGDDFLNFYLIPMSSAVWSTPPEAMLDFPAVTLLRFFHNHGFLGLRTQHQWLTVAGGARSYVKKITAPIADRIRVGRPVASVVRERNGVKVTTTDGSVQVFDRVIFASHADQTLRMLSDASPMESRLLREFKYQPNLATVHTDESLMPRTRLCWSSWNYRIDRHDESGGGGAPATIYWMNSLQGVSDRRNYFVSINGERRIDPAKILKQIPYEHPLFNLAAIQAQSKLPKLNQQSPNQRVYFCGSYFKYGFHEDAFASALELCRVIRDEKIWE